MSGHDGYYWTGWLQPDNSTTLYGLWHAIYAGELVQSFVQSAATDSDALRAQKKENALNSLIAAVEDQRERAARNPAN